MSRDYFEHKAGVYDEDNSRVSNIENIAKAIINNVNLNPKMHLMDFGSGTGLLLERIAPFVRKITAVDVSKSMNDQLEKKRPGLGCELKILDVDLETSVINEKFDGIVSSMTMHHVQDIQAMFAKFFSLLNKDGVIAISDLDKEDGSFHTEDTGVYHLGFNREEIAKAANQAGFREVQTLDASMIHKPKGDFPVFLLVAKR